MRVLIIEDARDTAVLLELMLRHFAADFDVTTRVERFGTVTQDVDWDRVDAVVVDKHLEFVDGADILCWIEENHPRIRRVMLTADTSVDPAEVCAHKTLVKPVSGPILVAALRGDT